jgi:hypothetical protein
LYEFKFWKWGLQIVEYDLLEAIFPILTTSVLAKFILEYRGGSSLIFVVFCNNDNNSNNSNNIDRSFYDAYFMMQIFYDAYLMMQQCHPKF